MLPGDRQHGQASTGMLLPGGMPLHAANYTVHTELFQSCCSCGYKDQPVVLMMKRKTLMDALSRFSEVHLSISSLIFLHRAGYCILCFSFLRFHTGAGGQA